ncbi:MAG: GAF domain-containing protein [Candidatus Omnitrophica bacterium]|nr:GAF domain-containing protein [Candidatus Omnitrophota bacterium]
MLKIFFISTLATSVFLIALSLFAIYKNYRSGVNLSFSSTVLSGAVWLYCYSRAYQALEIQSVIFWFKLGYLGIIFIPITYFHFANILIQVKNTKWLVVLNYLVGGLLAVLLLKTNLLINGVYHYPWGNYPRAGIMHPYFLIFFLAVLNIASLQIFFKIFDKKEVITQTRKQQLIYILSAFLIVTLCCADFLPNYGIAVCPLGFIPITLFLIIICYSIVRYQLMNIKIIITRAGIFIFVYAFVLGVPVWVGFKLLGTGLWFLPISLMGFFATVGPFIYFYIQNRAENRLLKDQRRYQATLRQASAGMGRIKDLKKLLNMIVFVLTRAIQIEHALIYIYNEGQKQYVLGASKRKSGNAQFIRNIEEGSELVRYLSTNRNLIIYEEIKQKALDFKDSGLARIAQIILSLEGALVVPIFIDENLTAIIIMGKKDSEKLYSEDDLAVFSILANQTALAIENAKFYEDMQLTHEQLFQAEKMATIGTMADGLSHQINNRFHALGFIAGDALDTIHMNQKELSADQAKEVLTELERAFVRVQENVVQGGEIVQGLLKYTRKGEAGFTAVDVQAVFKSALEMAQFKIKVHELKIVREYDAATIPKIKGNFTQLQEVFFNLIDNGYDAMMQRKNEVMEASYQPTLIVRVLKEDNYAQIIFEDNGMGVKDEDMHKLFTPFFTTKLSSKKGTGLGLYVIRKIVEDNHKGKVEMSSKYMQGTQMKLRLPIAIG